MLAAWDIFRRLVWIKVRAQLQYRVSFWLDFLATVLTSSIAFVSLFLVLQRFAGIGGWTLWEIALLYGMVELPFGIMDMVFSGFDPALFGRYVRLGVFDQMLLRPINITIQVLSSEFFLRRLGRIFQGGVVLGLAIFLSAPHWNAGKYLYLAVVLLSQVCFYGGLFVIGATITFWTVESIEVMNIFTYGGTEMTAYPMHIYPDWMIRVFTYIVPAIFLNYYPALYFLDKPDPFGMPLFARHLAPLVGVGTLALASLFWQFGVRHYQSTGT